MPNTFTLEGRLLSAKDSTPLVGVYVRFRVESAGTDTEDNVTFPRLTFDVGPTDANGDLPATELWINGDSGVRCYYRIFLTEGEVVDVVIPSSVEGTTVRLEDILELYRVDSSTQQSTVLATAIQRVNHTGGPDDLDGNDIVGVGGLTFSTTAPSASTAIGTQRWNDTDKCIETVINANTFLQNGQELLTRVRNTTGSTILNGQAVRVDGSTGDRPAVALSQADTLANASRTLGVATADIENNADGFVCRFGSARSINTNAFAPGSTVYVSDSVAGGLTTTKPAIAVEVGLITVSGVGNGVIEVSVDGRLPDIAGITPADGVFPVGDGTKWVGESGGTARISIGVENSLGGGKVGFLTTSQDGFAGGLGASTQSGGAVGAAASSTNGFAGGANAIASASGASQIGTGTNSTANTIQFRNSGSVTATQFGKLAATTTSVTITTYTALVTDKCLLVNDDTAGAAVTVTLPLAATAGDGFELVVKKLGSTANVIVDGNGSETIDGATTATLTLQYESLSLICDGSNWHII